jgi:hypothetical protein
VLRTLGPGDYLCQIKDSHDQTPLIVRVVFVYRNGFRRRRLVTSLLDPILFPGVIYQDIGVIGQRELAK